MGLYLSILITQLTIKNYALIDDVQLKLSSGLTVITGETGAGKSIILGALGLLLGKRADATSVKVATKKCIIEGYFAINGYNLELVFQENNLDFEEITIVRREILPGGKSRAFVNDSPVSLNQLQAIATLLVDVHSQNETQELGQEDFQIEVVDSVANNSANLETYNDFLNTYRDLNQALEQAKSRREDANKELDYNSFLLQELEALNLSKIDQQQLEETFETLNNTETIEEAFVKVIQLLSEDQIGSLESAKEARQSLSKIKQFSSSNEDIYNRLNSFIIELEDILENINDLAEKIEPDPEMLLQVNEKLQALYKLQQKHSVNSVEALIEIENALSLKVESTHQLDSEIEKYENELLTASINIKKIGEKISQNRTKAIPDLKKKIESYLLDLGLPNAKFDYILTHSPTFRKNGTDNLEVLFTANKGLAMGSLKKTASGGEMSRIMLATKSVLAQYKNLPTIVFDEIDTGVSGEIANKMAKIMAEMAAKMQVISITHLPQIAAKGMHHIKVYKEDINEVTYTQIKELNREQRLTEIAQMLSGNQISDAALANAKELLN